MEPEKVRKFKMGQENLEKSGNLMNSLGIFVSDIHM